MKQPSADAQASSRERRASQTTVRHLRLLAALLAFHLVGPAVETTAPRVATLVLLPMYVVVLGAAALAMTGGRRRVLGMLALPLVVAIAYVVVADDARTLVLPVAALPFLTYTCVVVFREVLAPGVVDETKLLGSASVFVLLAQLWAGVYAGLEWFASGSFVSVGGVATPGDLVYFSLVTQTTLGYGDVTPVSPFARACATLQATAGLFYMGVVVARFAGRLELRGG
jgi:hypothetical protein